MVGRIAERVEHHHAVGDGGVDAAEPVVAVQPLGDEGDRLVDGAVAAAARETAAAATRSTQSTRLEEPAPAASGTARGSSRAPARAACGTAPGSCTPRGLRARGRSAISTSSGTITVRDQYDTFDRWNGNHSGRCMISSGITGTARHGTWPNSASCARVKTLVRSAPPAARIAARARAPCAARPGRRRSPSARNTPSRWPRG